MSSSQIRAVFFDAVGTLIHVWPSAAEVYHTVGRRFGSCLTRDVIAARFRCAFLREDERDRAAGWKTSEARERERWQRIVGSVLNDVADVEGCFRELWEHFGRAEAWRCEPGLEAVLGELTERGLALGVVSNFDSRLRRVLAGLTPLRSLWRLVISAEVGWRKPAGAFFANLRKVTGWSCEQILVVGDDPINDAEGARAAGLRTILLDERTRLTELPAMLDRLI
jgi:putative hydrolase of the HAD superfamily